ncbi:MAG: MmcQ/YjbR family DNA-binding protein [Cellulomonas sp.]|nr:MmcQ/YjbR family DNA-binding protein [Cellulomonas sp.]
MHAHARRARHQGATGPRPVCLVRPGATVDRPSGPDSDDFRIHHTMFALLWRNPRVSTVELCPGADLGFVEELIENSYDDVVAGLPARLRSSLRSLRADEARGSVVVAPALDRLVGHRAWRRGADLWALLLLQGVGLGSVGHRALSVVPGEEVRADADPGPDPDGMKGAAPDGLAWSCRINAGGRQRVAGWGRSCRRSAAASSGRGRKPLV